MSKFEFQTFCFLTFPPIWENVQNFSRFLIMTPPLNYGVMAELETSHCMSYLLIGEQATTMHKNLEIFGLLKKW